jgi:hypothetical protein
MGRLARDPDLAKGNCDRAVVCGISDRKIGGGFFSPRESVAGGEQAVLPERRYSSWGTAL